MVLLPCPSFLEGGSLSISHCSPLCKLASNSCSNSTDTVWGTHRLLHVCFVSNSYSAGHKSQSSLNQGLYLPGFQGHPWSIALRGGGEAFVLCMEMHFCRKSQGSETTQTVTHSDHWVPLKRVRKISGWSESVLLSG